MKKLILIGLTTGFVALNSFGQGQLFIGNTSTSKISTNGVTATVGMTGGSVMPGNSSPPGTAYEFAAYAYWTGSLNTSTNSGTTAGVAGVLTPWANSSWELVGYGTNTTGSGRLGDTGVLGYETVANIPVGVYATIELIGWNVAVGGSDISAFTTAYNANTAGLLFGASLAGSILLGNGTVPPNTTILGTGAGNIAGFTLGTVAAVPEPSTMALAALGGASLLLFRRRKV